MDVQEAIRRKREEQRHQQSSNSLLRLATNPALRRMSGSNHSGLNMSASSSSTNLINMDNNEAFLRPPLNRLTSSHSGLNLIAIEKGEENRILQQLQNHNSNFLLPVIPAMQRLNSNQSVLTLSTVSSSANLMGMVSKVEEEEQPETPETNLDPWHARQESLAYALTSVTGLYALILVSVYVSFTFTELVTFPEYQLYLEKNGFFVYLYLVGDLFLVYVLFFTMRGNGASSKGSLRVVENHKSHGSLTVRFGALVFGIGNLIYLTLEMVAFFEVRVDSPCYSQILGANVGLAIIFVILQTYLIFVFPRLNLRIIPGVDSFGTMHLVATNVVMWIRTLVKESLYEIAESLEETHHRAEEEAAHLAAAATEAGGHHSVESGAHANISAHVEGATTPAAAALLHHPTSSPLHLIHRQTQCNFLGDRIMEYERQQLECMEHRNDMLGDALLKSSPYLYPFVIEYALISASVLFLMWMHVGKMPRKRSVELEGVTIRKPQPREFLRKGDWSYTMRGMWAGMMVFTLAMLNIGLFFGLTVNHKPTDDAEFYSKAVNTTTNLIGILALVIGLGQIQLLDKKKKRKDDDDNLGASDKLDLTLLRFTAFFSYLYHNFTVITGSFNMHVHNFPNELHIVNGVTEATEITLQLIFLIELKKRMLPEGNADGKPGRQVTVFLFLLNLSQWIVTTFEIQKVRASLVEAEFYGFMPWVVIQRVTLPLAVFFRFHSAVVSIELWKEIYCCPN